jgi:preprotein translocase subunit SecD
MPSVSDPAALTPVEIVGPIDTPEELGEAFRRIDEVRQGRSEVRRQIIDQRIDSAIERRRAAGLPVPSPEGEARLRERIDAVRAEREGREAERIQARRVELERRLENGEALTREDFRPSPPQGKPRLRDLTPQERRAILRDLSPEDRRAATEEYRRWRAQRERQQLRRARGGETAAAPSPDAATAGPPGEAASPQAQPPTGEE